MTDVIELFLQEIEASEAHSYYNELEEEMSYLPDYLLLCGEVGYNPRREV